MNRVTFPISITTEIRVVQDEYEHGFYIHENIIIYQYSPYCYYFIHRVDTGEVVTFNLFLYSKRFHELSYVHSWKEYSTQSLHSEIVPEQYGVQRKENPLYSPVNNLFALPPIRTDLWQFNTHNFPSISREHPISPSKKEEIQVRAEFKTQGEIRSTLYPQLKNMEPVNLTPAPLPFSLLS